MSTLRWARFETEMAKRLAVVTERHKEEVRAVQTEKTAIQLRLQTTEKLAGEQKTLDVQRVRIELEGICARSSPREKTSAAAWRTISGRSNNSGHIWTVEELISLLPVEQPKKRGPYKKRA